MSALIYIIAALTLAADTLQCTEKAQAVVDEIKAAGGEALAIQGNGAPDLSIFQIIRRARLNPALQ